MNYIRSEAESPTTFIATNLKAADKDADSEDHVSQHRYWRRLANVKRQDASRRVVRSLLRDAA